jgi:hypothetical protein
MFESRYQIAQLILGVAFVLLALAILTLMFGPVVVGVVCLVLEHAVAAVGCAVYADAKGYPYLVGIPIGVALGTVGGLAFVVLPDESKEDEFERQHRMAGEAYRNARNRDPGYEVLDDDD